MTSGIRETVSTVTVSITADRTVPTSQHALQFLPAASRLCVAFPHGHKPSSAAMQTDRTNQHDRNRLGRSTSFGAAWFPSRVSITQEYWWRMTSVARHVINKTAWNKVQGFSILKTHMTDFIQSPPSSGLYNADVFMIPTRACHRMEWNTMKNTSGIVSGSGYWLFSG